MSGKNSILVNIEKKIFIIRGLPVMIDRDLAEMYGTETRSLKQAVKRNERRFPNDFMFTLSESEINMMVSQNVIPSKSFFGGALPMAFTEQGVAMLSSVLNSEKAVAVNIQIIRVFVKLRQAVKSNDKLRQAIEIIGELALKNRKDIEVIFKVLEKMIDVPEKPRRKIGFEAPKRES